ncbi:hypothetical protein [Salinarimonas sp.]|uniref:hypothetical protein n=1 Tax=Salinarimonas sp. TaxID=2766526 RepID=UPI0032D8E6F6
MNRILMMSAAALLVATPASAQQAAPPPVVDKAPAVPQTAIGVQERRRLVTSDDDTAAPAGLLVERQRQVIDCLDPRVECAGLDPIVDAAPAVPGTAIGVQERRRLTTSDDDTAAPAGFLIERQATGPVEVEATGAVPPPVTDMAPAVPRTAIGVQERRRLLADDDATAAPAEMLIEPQ